MSDDRNPYAAPATRLEDDSPPAKFDAAAVPASRFRRDGWIVLIYLLLQVPVFYLYVVAGADDGPGDATLYATALNTLSGVIEVHLLLELRRLLQVRLEFFRADRVISATVWTLAALLVVAPLYGDGTDSTGLGMTALYLGLICVLGLLTLWLGIKLLAIPRGMPGLKLYAWMQIFGGLSLATVFLLLLSLPFALVAGIVLMTMFFRVAREIDALAGT